MMKSGLSQNEKLTALRFVINNIDEKTLNAPWVLDVVAFEKDLKLFVDAGIKAPYNFKTRQTIEVILGPISDHVLHREYRAIILREGEDPLSSLRAVTHHVGQHRAIMEAEFKSSEHYCIRGCFNGWTGLHPALLEYAFDVSLGDYYAYDAYRPWRDDEYDGELLFYYGRELNGDFLFMTMRTQDYKKRVVAKFPRMDKRDVDTTKLTRMCPADVAKLHREPEPINCYACDDRIDEEGNDDGCSWGCEACNDAFWP